MTITTTFSQDAEHQNQHCMYCQSLLRINILLLSSSHSSLNSTQLNSAKIISEMSEEIVPIFALYHHHHHQYSFSTLKVLTSPKFRGSIYGKQDETRASQNLNPWSLTLMDSKLVLVTIIIAFLEPRE